MKPLGARRFLRVGSFTAPPPQYTNLFQETGYFSSLILVIILQKHAILSDHSLQQTSIRGSQRLIKRLFRYDWLCGIHRASRWVCMNVYSQIR
jgi:hypothetical protein